MDDCKPIKTPMPINGHLNLDEGGKSVDQTLYHSMIGSLLYQPHLGPISCLVYVCELAFKQILRSHTLVPLRGSLDISNIHLPQACGTPKALVLHSWDTRIRTLPDVMCIARAHRVGATCQGVPWSLGLQRNKISWPCQPLRWNTLPTGLVVLKSAR